MLGRQQGGQKTRFVSKLAGANRARPFSVQVSQLLLLLRQLARQGLLLALLLNMLLGLTGQSWLPDVLALVLVFWTIHQPRRVGMLTAFVLGLAVDVHESALLGQNALAYICLSHLANLIHRRVLWFPLREQTVQVLVRELFLLAEVVTPNLDEAALLLGHAIDGVDALDAAARALRSLGAQPASRLVLGRGHAAQ